VYKLYPIQISLMVFNQTKEGSEILTAVLMTIQVFWDATPC